MADHKPLKVMLDARITSGVHGGIEQVIIGMADSLSSLQGDEHYIFLTLKGQSEWLKPYVSGSSAVVEDKPTLYSQIFRKFRYVAKSVRRGRLRHRAGSSTDPPPVPASNGLAEKMGVDVVHFLKQDGFVTNIPSIYHPHDLQHIHLPEFFSESDRRLRNLWYSTLCDRASRVSVSSHWGKRDLAQHLGVPEKKIIVVPLAPAIAAYKSIDRGVGDKMRNQLSLPEEFALFPAQTWPHKNHIRLLRALALVRDQGTDIHLVCPGRKNEHYEEISRTVESLRLEDRVFFPGFVPPDFLQALYQEARCLVMPTLFEAAGGFGPIAEAFLMKVPVACSNVTSLPEQVGDSALVFDPYNVLSIASALHSIWTDQMLRAALVEKGLVKISGFNWNTTALMFRAHYRLLAGCSLTVEDRALILDSQES